MATAPTQPAIEVYAESAPERILRHARALNSAMQIDKRGGGVSVDPVAVTLDEVYELVHWDDAPKWVTGRYASDAPEEAHARIRRGEWVVAGHPVVVV